MRDFWTLFTLFIGIVTVAVVFLAIGKTMGHQAAMEEMTSSSYSTLVPLTEVYHSGCIYGVDSYAIELPEGVNCPEHIAILH